MAGSVTPSFVIEYVAKASPGFAFTLKDDAGAPVDLTGATLSAYMIGFSNGQPVQKMYGTFTIANQSTNKGQASYQWTLIDVNVIDGFHIYFSAKLPSEPFQREFAYVTLTVLPTPEFYGGLYMQEVDLNVGGAPNTAGNPVYADVVDRLARILGHVIVDTLPPVTGAVAPQVGGSNVSTSNPLPTTSGQVGPVAQWGSNPSATNAGSETQIKFGAGGTTTVQRIIMDNESGADVRYRFDGAASANSLRLKDGNVIFAAQPTTVLHLYTAGAVNINQAGGIIIEGYN